VAVSGKPYYCDRCGRKGWESAEDAAYAPDEYVCPNCWTADEKAAWVAECEAVSAAVRILAALTDAERRRE
jgi:hypothetical protein